MDRREEVTRIFPREIRAMLRKLDVDFGQVEEIRLRTGKPLLILTAKGEYGLTADSRLSGNPALAYRVSAKEMRETLEYMSSFSLYAFEEEIRQGFLTIPGGHRVGLAGHIVMADRGIVTIKFISFLNVRLAHEIRGCADEVLPHLYEGNHLLDTLILSPPRCGKTTLLRDLIRKISDGEKGVRGRTVGVIDERSEIGACYQGVPQNDLGMRTDVLDCCPKALGMMMLVRSMAPEVIAVDEIGGTEELKAMAYAMNSGCTMLATAHGESWDEISRKPGFAEMVASRRFARYVVLDNQGGAGHVKSVCDGEGKPLSGSEGRRKEALLWRQCRPG